MNRRLLPLAALGMLLFLVSGCEGIKLRYWMNEGNKLFKGQKYEDALKEYAKILKIHPMDWDANYQVAVSYLALYHPNSTHPKDLEYAERGIAALEKLLGLKAPDNETVEKVRGFYIGLLNSAAKTDKAISYYETLVQKDPRNPTYLAQLAQLYAKKGDSQLAIRFFQKRAEIEPGNKEAWYTIGVVCWERSYRGGITVSSEERAELIAAGQKALQKALSLDPDYFEALSYTNLLYREQAKVEQTAGDYEGALRSTQKADDFMRKALEVRKKQIAASKSKAA